MAKAPRRTSHDSVLLDLVETIGKLSAQSDMIISEQVRAAESRHETYQKLDEVNIKLTKFDAVAETVAGMKPIVADYQRSKFTAVGMLIAATGFASAIGYFASEIRALLFRH